MFKTYYPSLVDQSAVPIQKGGTDGVTAIEATDNLSMVTDIMNNKPNGWLAMPAGGIVDPSRLPLGMQSKKVTIDGPLTLVGGTPTDYLITNFDSFDQYVFTDVDGTISRADDIITFIPLISGGVLGYTVNGWRYEFDVTPVTVNKPIIDGLENSTDLGPYQSFTSSPFSVDGGTGTHVSSDWQISESNSFSSILPSSVNASAANKTSFEVSDLPANKSLFIRVRYNSQIHGVSAWSDPVSFSTRMSYLPETPSITFPVNNATGISSSITVTSTAYVGHGITSTGMDTMTSAQWEYSADNTFPGASTTSVIKLVDNSPTNLAITGLTANISYYVRVRYLSSLGGAAFSDWSPTVMFTTAVSFKPGAPSITSPASGAIEQDSNLTLTSSAFITTSGDTHQGTSWEVNTNASFSGTSYAAINNSATNKLSLSLVNLPANTTLYARVMHHGVVTGASDWSSPINFRTKTVTINTPIVSGSATVSILTPSFTSTPYALSDPAATLDAHLQSIWEVYAVANPSVIIADSQNSVGSKTAFQVGAGLLSYGTAYAIRVKYIGSLYGESAYSTPFNFSISSVTVNTPSVLLAAFGGGGGATVDSITPTFTSSAFAQTPTSGGLIHIQSTWQVSDTSSFTNIMSTNTGFVIGGTNTLTSWTVGTGTVNTPMVAGGSYYVRVKHTGTGNIDSQWSTPQAFTVAGGVNSNWTPTVIGNTALVALGATESYRIILDGVTVGQTFTYTATANGVNIGSGSITATSATYTAYNATGMSLTIPSQNTTASWNISVTITSNGVSKTVTTTTQAAVANGNLAGVVMVVSPTTIQPLSAYTISVGMTNAPASIGDVTVVIQYLTNNVWTNLPDPLFTKTAGVGTITNGNNRSVTYNLTHSAPVATDTTWILRAKVTQSNPTPNTNTAESGQTTVVLKAAANTNWTPTILGPVGTVALGASANYTVTLSDVTVGQVYAYTVTANGSNIGTGTITATQTSFAFGVALIIPSQNTTASWNISATITNNGVSKTATATTQAAVYTNTANWTADLVPPGGTIGLGMVAGLGLTINNATIGQTYTYSATARINGNVSPLPAPFSIGSGSIVATAVNNTYATNLGFTIPLNNTAATYAVSATVTNAGTNKYPGSSVSAAVYTAPVNITGTTLSISPATINPYATANFTVVVNGAPDSLGNVNVQIEGFDGTSWIDLDPTFYLKNVPMSGSSSRTLNFTVTHSNPGTSDVAVSVRARAYQASNTSNLFRSDPPIVLTLKGVVPQTNVYVRGFTGSSWIEMNPSTVINGDGGAGYVNLAVCAQNLPVAEEQPFIVLITSVDGGQIFYSGQLAALHGDSSWFSTDSQPSNRIYQVSHRAVASHLNSPEFLAHMGYANTGVGWGVGFRHYGEINIEDNVTSRTLAMDVTRQCVITIHSATSPFPEVARASSYYTFRTRAYLVPAINPG
jgi:hypothetical protein